MARRAPIFSREFYPRSASHAPDDEEGNRPSRFPMPGSISPRRRRARFNQPVFPHLLNQPRSRLVPRLTEAQNAAMDLGHRSGRRSASRSLQPRRHCCMTSTCLSRPHSPKDECPRVARRVLLRIGLATRSAACAGAATRCSGGRHSSGRPCARALFGRSALAEARAAGRARKLGSASIRQAPTSPSWLD